MHSDANSTKTDLGRRVVLHLAAVPLVACERLARARVPELHDARLVAAREQVPVVAPAQAVHLIAVHRDAADRELDAVVVERDRAVAEADREHVPAPAEAADVRVVLLAPVDELRLRVRVPEVHLAVHRPRREQVRQLGRPLDRHEPAAVARGQLEEVADPPCVELLEVDVEPAGDSDRVS